MWLSKLKLFNEATFLKKIVCKCFGELGRVLVVMLINIGNLNFMSVCFFLFSISFFFRLLFGVGCSLYWLAVKYIINLNQIIKSFFKRSFYRWFFMEYFYHFLYNDLVLWFQLVLLSNIFCSCWIV